MFLPHPTTTPPPQKSFAITNYSKKCGILLLLLLFKNNNILFVKPTFTKNGRFWTTVDFQTFETKDHQYTKRNT